MKFLKPNNSTKYDRFSSYYYFICSHDPQEFGFHLRVTFSVMVGTLRPLRNAIRGTARNPPVNIFGL